MEMEIEVELPEGSKPDFGVAVSNRQGEEYRVGFDAAGNLFYSDRTKAGKAGFSKKFAAGRHSAARISGGKTVRLHLYFDAASCELFADNGEVSMTDIYFPTADFSQVQLYSSNGRVVVKTLKAWEVKRAF